MALKKSGGPVVGLDIGTSFIKACEIDARGGKANLRGIAVLPTPPEALANTEIVDPVALGKVIKSVLQQSGIKAKKVVTCVAGQSSLVVRIIEVPKMTRNELAETMKWEIERHVPFAAEQVVMDYQPLVPPEEVPEGQNMEVLLAVAQEALVMRHVEAVQAAGLQPLAIDIEPLAVSRSLIDLSNGMGPSGTTAIIDLGATTSDISIYRDGRLAFTRSIQLAGNSLTKAIADNLGQPLAEAERMKKEMAVVVDQVPSDNEMPGGDLFGDQFGGMGGLDFGSPGPEPLGGMMLGGTFGMGGSPTETTPDPGATTASDTHSEPEVNIAGGGFTAEAFTSPSEGEPAAEGEAPAFGAPAEAAASPFGSYGVDPALAGPTPQGNPFDPDAGLVGSGSTTQPDNPFESSIFGSLPGGDPFAPPADLSGFGAGPQSASMLGDIGAQGATPAAMTEEDYLRTQITDAIMPILQELVTELRRSLDFYRNRANGLGAQQILLTGGTAKLPGLADYLTVNLETPTMVGNPLQYLSTGPKADPTYLQDVGPVFPVSVGLALRELLVEPPAPRRKKK